jgi:hypothetical protein
MVQAGYGTERTTGTCILQSAAEGKKGRATGVVQHMFQRQTRVAEGLSLWHLLTIARPA